jgi:hypothetical protein
MSAESLSTDHQLTVADYEQVLAGHQRLVRELDVILNGDGAAKQASLCDIVGQCAMIQRRLNRPLLEGLWP